MWIKTFSVLKAELLLLNIWNFSLIYNGIPERITKQIGNTFLSFKYVCLSKMKLLPSHPSSLILPFRGFHSQEFGDNSSWVIDHLPTEIFLLEKYENVCFFQTSLLFLYSITAFWFRGYLFVAWICFFIH